MFYILLLLYLFHFNLVICMSPVTKDLLTPLIQYGEGCGYMSCPIMGRNVLNVHIVPSTHGELGDMRTFYQHYTGYDDISEQSKVSMKNILDATITALWAHAERKFTFSDMPYLFHWWQNRDLTVKRMVYQLLRQGRLYFNGGGWSMTDEATTSYHAIIDHFTYSLRKINATFLECGRPLVTWQADVFGHTREFASLMAQMGFDAHFISPISYDDELARMRSKSLEFVWRGSDDLGPSTDIYTHKLFDGFWAPPGFCFGQFCHDPLIITSDKTFANVEERMREFLQQVHERQSPYYTTRHVMIMMGQKLAYYDAEIWFANIDKLIGSVNSRQGNNKHGKVYLFYSTPACYVKAVHEAMPNLSTKQDDFIPLGVDRHTHATGMYTSRPVIKYLARETHLYVQIAKQLQIFAQLGNNDKKFEEIMWISGVLQDHTVITGAMRPIVADYYAKKAYLAREISMQMFRPAFNILRNSSSKMIYYACHFNISSCWTLEGNRFFIVVYNPLAWAVTLPIRLPVARGIYKVYDPKGVQHNHSLITIHELVMSLPDRGDFLTEDELVFIADKIPPLGFRSYFIERIQLRTRTRRSVLKRIFNHNNKSDTPKKDFTRETSFLKRENKYLLDDLPEYEYFEDVTEKGHYKVPLANSARAKYLEFYSDYVGTQAPVTNETEEESSTETKKVLMTTSSWVPLRTSTTFTTSTSSTISVTRTTTEPLPTTTKPTTTATTTIKSTTTVPTTTEATTTTTEATTTTTEATTTTTEPTSTTEEQTEFMTTRRFVPFNFFKTTDEPIEYYDYETTPLPVESTTPFFDFEKFYRRMEKSGYHSMESSDSFIQNEYIKINVDKDQQPLNIILSNGVNISFAIQMCYYVSDDPDKMGTKKRTPGAYIFRPIDSQPILITDLYDSKILKSDVVQEIQIRFASYAGLSLRLYKSLPTIEIDWIVGPIPKADGLGKEVFVRYVTDLSNKGVFYTDSNGRQTVKRIRDARPTFLPTIIDSSSAVAGNVYPVTSKIYIEDQRRNIRLSIFTDRCQGGTSLIDGHIDLFLHRRILTDDSKMKTYFNETQLGQAIIVRGKQHLYLSKADYRPNKVFEKKFAKELELTPKVFASIHESYFNISLTNWNKNKNEYSALNLKLPIGVHILTLEKWHDKYLLRLENYLEKADVARNGYKKVFLRELFKDFVITEARETLLAGNMWLKDYYPMRWQKDRFVKNFNDVYGNYTRFEFAKDEEYEVNRQNIDLDEGIGLMPQQIRTFVVSYVRR